jgi:hypothetical protein
MIASAEKQQVFVFPRIIFIEALVSETVNTYSCHVFNK